MYIEADWIAINECVGDKSDLLSYMNYIKDKYKPDIIRLIIFYENEILSLNVFQTVDSFL